MKWICDRELTARAAIAKGERDASILRVRDDATSPRRDPDTFLSVDGPPILVAFSPDGTSLWAITSKDVNTSRLIRHDLATGARNVIYEDMAYVVSIVFGAQPYVDPATGELLAIPILRERIAWHALVPEFADDLDAIGRGELSIESADATGETLVVQHRVNDGPSAFSAYRCSTREATILFHDQPAVLDYRLAPRQSVQIRARDGRTLHGYLTPPLDVPTRDLPTVLYIRGGPWLRDRWHYEPFVQRLANRGYAVLQVNFRGSIGYVRDFRNAGNREWAGAMRTDLWTRAIRRSRRASRTRGASASSAGVTAAMPSSPRSRFPPMPSPAASTCAACRTSMRSSLRIRPTGRRCSQRCTNEWVRTRASSHRNRRCIARRRSARRS